MVVLEAHYGLKEEQSGALGRGREREKNPDGSMRERERTESFTETQIWGS